MGKIPTGSLNNGEKSLRRSELNNFPAIEQNLKIKLLKFYSTFWGLSQPHSDLMLRYPRTLYKNSHQFCIDSWCILCRRKIKAKKQCKLKPSLFNHNFILLSNIFKVVFPHYHKCLFNFRCFRNLKKKHICICSMNLPFFRELKSCQL